MGPGTALLLLCLRTSPGCHWLGWGLHFQENRSTSKLPQVVRKIHLYAAVGLRSLFSWGMSAGNHFRSWKPRVVSCPVANSVSSLQYGSWLHQDRLGNLLQEGPNCSFKGFRLIQSDLPSIVTFWLTQRQLNWDLNHICKIPSSFHIM